MTPPVERRLATAGGELWACGHGAEKSGTPLLVIHGGPGFLSMPETVSALADERPVWFYDQLGCGRSARATDPDWYTPQRYVEELAEVRALLGLSVCHLMGFSWGTMLAVLYMLERKPQGVESLLLCAPYLSTPLWEADQRRHIARLPADVRRAIESSERAGEFGPQYRRAMLAYYRRHLCLLDPWPPFVREAFARMNEDIYRRLWGPSEFTVTGLLKTFDLTPHLGEIDRPVLLTCGDRDEARVETVNAYREAFPNADLAVLPRAAHLHQIEQPEIFLSAVRRFLARVEGRITA